MIRPTTLDEIASQLGSSVDGDGRRVVSAVATLDEADASALSWLGSEKYVSQLARSRAGGVLIPAAMPPPPSMNCIRVADPDLALCSVLERLAPAPPRVSIGIHPSAEIHPDARVGAEAAIGPHVCVGPHAVIGARTQLHAGVYVGDSAQVGCDCVLWPNVVVRDRCVLGDRVIVHPNATIGADGFGYLFRKGKHVKVPQVGIVVIEDDVEIGANTAIDRAKSGVTHVGRGTKIDNLVQIGHNCRIGADCVVVAQAGLSGSCTLGHHVLLAGQVGLSDHVRIGDGAQVSGQSGVQRDIEAGAYYRGTPAAPARAAVRQYVALTRLPALLEQVRQLEKRIEQLESAKNDQG